MNSHECPATSKVCKTCGQDKPISQFYKNKLKVDGSVSYQPYCIDCYKVKSAQQYQRRKQDVLDRCKKYKATNKERIAQYMRDYYARNRDQIIAKTKAYQARPERKQADSERQAQAYKARKDFVRKRQNERNATPEGKAKQRERYLKHYAENFEYYLAKGAARRARQLQATPSWISANDCLEFYKKARQMTQATGERHVVDHIVPLKGRKVCGLHVPWNLQVITEAENLSKFNHFEADDIVRHSDESRRTEDKEPLCN